MGLKEKIRGAVTIGSIAAATTFLPENAEASHNIDDISFNPKLKDAKEFVVDHSLAEQEEISQAEQGQTHEFLEKIKKGEKIEYNGMSFDTQKLNASKNKDLKKFSFAFEDGQVGIKIHDDGKKFFGKNDPAKTYEILMPAEDFEGIMNMLMDKDQGKVSSERPDDPHDWVYKDHYPHFYTVDANGTRKDMTEAEAGKAFDLLADTIIPAMNSEGVLDGGKIIKKYENQIKEADYGWVLAKAANAPAIVQNKLISEGLKNYKPEFVKIAAHTDVLRAEAEKKFQTDQQVAINRLEREQKEGAARASAPVVTEHDRLAQIMIVDHIGKPTIETKDGTHLSFSCDGGRFDIHTDNQKITDSSVSFGGHRRALPIQPEEWRQISRSLEDLPEKTKKQLGSQFFKLVKEQGSPQTVASADTSKKAPIPATIIAAGSSR